MLTFFIVNNYNSSKIRGQYTSCGQWPEHL